MLVWCDLVFICCQFISWKIRVKWNYLNQVSGLSKLYLNTFQMKLTGRWLAWLTCLVSCRSTSAQYQASSSPGFMDNINFDDFIHSSAPGTYLEGTRKVSYSNRGIMPAKLFITMQINSSSSSLGRWKIPGILLNVPTNSFCNFKNNVFLVYFSQVIIMFIKKSIYFGHMFHTLD